MVGRIVHLFRLIFTLPIVFYQKFISPAFPSACIYTPSCSHYTKDAILKHGVFFGLIYGILRVFRCNGWFFRGGDDPVPEKLTLDIFKAYSRFRKGTYHLSDSSDKQEPGTHRNE